MIGHWGLRYRFVREAEVVDKRGKLWKCEEVGKDHFIIGDETGALNNKL